jgi:hypothetical protein
MKRLADRRNGDRDADAEDVLVFRVALVLVDEHEAARIGQPLEAVDRRHAAEGGEHHREGEGQLMRRLDGAGLIHFLDEHLAGLDLLHLGVGDPLDVPLAHCALE